jgi:hypothetical protein
MNISLKDFVSTGKFGEITLGLTQSEVKALLGEPDAMGGVSRKYPVPRLWIYGNFEFFFNHEKDGGKLVYLSLPSFEESPVVSSNIIFDAWIFKADLSLEEATKHFKRENISFELAQTSEFIDLNADDVVMKLETRAGANIYFLNDKLFSLNLKDKTPAPVKKQLSVTLPLEAYEKIRQESVRTKIPIAKLCSDYLEQYAKEL